LNTQLNETLQLGSTFTSRTGLAVLLALFCAGLFWVINNPATVHPDERLYTDAAIQMVRTGDYWTPFYPDGRVRLVKPILTYWAVAVFFHGFGINLFASRLASSLAGVFTVCLTFQLARVITGSRPVAGLAAAIIAANEQLLITSIRATPDALLCLFTLVSMWGFARVWFQRDQSCLGPLLAFGGMGLAVQTKGLLGLWPLAAATLFWVMAKPERGLTQKLLHWPAIATGIIMAVFWYAVMYYRHGDAAFQDIYEDQVGSRITLNPLSILGNAAGYLLSGLENFLPWVLLLLAIGFRQRALLATFWRDNRSQLLFALIPFVVLLAAFSLGTTGAQRYLTSALPMLAVLLASLLINIPMGSTVWKWVRRVALSLSGLGILVGTGLVVAGFNGCGLLIAGGVAILAVGVAGALALRSDDKLLCWVWISGLIVTIFVLWRSCLKPALYPQALPPLAKRLLQYNQSGTRVYTWQIRPSRAGLLRLLTEAKVPIGELSTNGELPDFSTAQLVVTTSPHESLFRQAGYDVAQIEPDNSACAPLQHLGQKLSPRRAKKGTIARETYWLATQHSRQAE
jgi:4-amino-4-deoxy-L-arabinose transferase-like glycosyltransferase